MPDRILAIDIGGSHLKGTILNASGEMQTSYEKVPTPQPARPESVLDAISQLAKRLTDFEVVSIGFPGYVKNGIVKTAPNLGTDFWKDFQFASEIQKLLGREVKLVNDADMQGLGVAKGNGFEIATTLGTGFGTAFLNNGMLLPHIEFAHHPVSKERDYDEYIGEKAYVNDGAEKWNKRIGKVITILRTVFNFDHLYLGGGNAKKITLQLPDDISIVSNKDGIKGGARLWNME